MFKLIREGWVGRKLLGFLILVFLNSSVNAPDIFSKKIAYNEQESLIELIIEKGLGFEEAIEEHEHDNELPEKSSAKKIKSDLSFEAFTLNQSCTFKWKKKLAFSYLVQNLSQDYSKIILLPPEVRA